MNSQSQVVWKAEVLVGAVVTFALVWIMRAALIQGETILAHDNLYWGYPVFQFYAEAILQGRFPLWNPFSHGGEPFYPLLVMPRLFDPSTFVVIKLGSLMTDDLVMLFNWDRFVKGIIIAVGTCLLLRQWAEHQLTRLALIPVVILSSYHLMNFRQVGVPDQFITAPFVLWLTHRILCDRDRRWRMWISLAVLLGMNMQGYFFSGIWTFLFLFFLGVALFRRDLIGPFLTKPALVSRLTALALILAIMCLPNLALIKEKREFVFPARMWNEPYEGKKPEGGPQQYEPGPHAVGDDSIVMTYGFVAHTGTFSKVYDFLQVLAPYGNRFINPTGTAWGDPSEAFMYFGMLTYLGAIFGLVHGRHDLKRVWMVAGVGMGLLLLGPVGGLHPLLFHVYPPLWFVRHTHIMVSFFGLTVLFFFVLGCNRLTQYLSQSSVENRASRVGDGAWHGNPFARGVLRQWLWPIGLITGLVTGGILALKLEDWGPELVLKGALLFAMLSFIANYRLVVGRRYLVGILVSIHLLLALLFMHGRGQWLLLIGTMLVGPLILIKCHLAYGVPSRALVRALLLIILTSDLLYYATHVQGLWDVKRPDILLRFPAHPVEPRLPESRTVFPPIAVKQWPYEQMIRYIDTTFRATTIFTPLLSQPTYEEATNRETLLKAVEAGLGGRRWNSYLMSKHYYRILYSGMPPEWFLDVFTVGQSLIQFRSNAVTMDDESAFKAVQAIEPQKLTAFLQHTVILSDIHDEPFLPTQTRGPSLGGQVRTELPVQKVLDGRSGFQWKVNHYDFNTLNLTVTVPREGFLYWADGYNPDWRAYVDGKRVQVHRANINFKAVFVPNGDHQVRFVYEPIFYEMALAVFLLMYGLLFIGVPLIVLAEKWRRAVRPPC